EALQQTLARYQDQLAPGDLLRMLKLLGESEPLLRRSASPRLAVETLLLRWVLMDRTVDLEAVLEAELPSRRAAEAPSSAAEPGTRRSSEPALAAPEAPARRSGESTTLVPFTLDGLLAAWSDLVTRARDQSRFLGEALAAAQPRAADPPSLTLAVPDGNPIHIEALGRQRDALERLLGEAVGGVVKLVLAEGPEGAPAAPRARRLTEAEARAERLRVLRARDPALEAAADSLDLEVLE
ncbi:MAG TPA: hypothetical protein VEI47_10760, partial [Gemmatimonadales bacterium]|nr:hypothetical protein [Gemmatimonadales bacterium]